VAQGFISYGTTDTLRAPFLRSCKSLSWACRRGGYGNIRPESAGKM